MSNWTDWPVEFTLSATQDFPGDFPNLNPLSCYDDVSAYDLQYNCIAWAAHDTTDWWEPDPDDLYYWPQGVPRVYTEAAYIQAYESVGFKRCGDAALETGVEKIALYTYNGQPTHAARQLPDGTWTSKLGPFEDIKHVDLACLEGPLYGEPTVYMMRQS
jgi:hypothetical protein